MDQVLAGKQEVGSSAPATTPAPRIAVLVPCFNEELTIGNVVNDFRAALPEAEIYVYDNNSTDRTIDVALKAGAICRKETNQGKGNVVRRMFADIEADVYILVDGDDTYDAASARRLIEPVLHEQADMVNAVRIATGKQAYRSGHRFGNTLLTSALSQSFGHQCKDILSGYRAMSRRFVKSFPALSEGFEIETEITVHAPSSARAGARGAYRRDHGSLQRAPRRIGQQVAHDARRISNPLGDPAFVEGREAFPILRIH